MTTPELTSAQKLTRIIQAQVKGGCKDFIDFTRHKSWLSSDQRGLTHVYLHPEWVSILDILFDPTGLRAAYGAHLQTQTSPPYVEGWRRAATLILGAWLSKPDGDAVAAIDTAHSLL